MKTIQRVIPLIMILVMALPAAAQNEPSSMENSSTLTTTEETTATDSLQEQSEKDEVTANQESPAQTPLPVAMEEEDTTAPANSNLFTTVKQGGPLMFFLLILALASLTLIIERVIYYSRHNTWNNDYLEILLKETNENDTSPYREDREEALRGTFQLYLNGMERGLPLLSGIGNLSPIVGFLGTVIGMISAFASIAAATTVNAKVVAVGIQIALVTTAGGLIVAAPTLAAYFFFVHLVQSRISHAESVIAGLTESLPRISSAMGDEQ